MKKSKTAMMKRIIKYLLFIVFLILFLLAIYINNNYKNVSFEQLLYSLIYSEGTSSSALIPGLLYILK